MAEGKLIGMISHYYDNIKVAVIDLKKALNRGENIRITGGENDFIQNVESIEMDYKKIEKAKAGDSIGIKIDQKVKPGYRVYKV